MLQDVPEDDRVTQIDLRMNDLPITKTLGLSWNALKDPFLFHFSSLKDDVSYTKRNVLRCTVTLFDPLRFVAPFTLVAKLLIHQAWVQGLDWECHLPEELCST